MGIFCTSNLTAQNLVPNPSFEDLKTCPTGNGQIAVAEPWQWVLTPDLYNSCSTDPSLKVPFVRSCEYLPAHTGEGYAGMYVYNSREYVKIRLLDTLEAGKYYYARFYVAPDEDCAGNVPTSFTDAIGLGLKGTAPNDNFEIVAEHSGTVIMDTANWTKVSGCFQAKGNELILQIGNFRDEDETILETDMPQIPNSQQFNYMYIDDVLITLFDPFPDTVLMCNGQPVNLDASFYDADFQWTTGDTNAFTVVFDTGSYTVIANIDGCTLREKVTVVDANFANLMPTDTTFCKGDEILLAPGIPGQYSWSNGKKTENIKVTKSGTYSATITNNCGEFNFKQKAIATDCLCRIYVPNVFSPNGDGINDLLEIGMGCDYEYETKHLEIYDRWGNSVFSTNKIGTEKWDGTYRGKPAQTGVYTWFLTYDLSYEGKIRSILEEGSVTLLD
ncbi:MAG: T9SS type B sorting domain-containing protein [Bacteroidetes bacterium]|nr:T9SS type B sorting domain-containing protein [Bacteroidota bacterium]